MKEEVCLNLATKFFSFTASVCSDHGITIHYYAIEDKGNPLAKPVANLVYSAKGYFVSFAYTSTELADKYGLLCTKMQDFNMLYHLAQRKVSFY